MDFTVLSTGSADQKYRKNGTMSRCAAGRVIQIALRRSREKDPTEYTVAIPSRWTKMDALRYIRSEHPKETVKILDWPTLDWSGEHEHVLWIATFDPRTHRPFKES